MRYLGIDYGSKRIGLALSDEQGNFAMPLKVLQTGVNTIKEIGAIVKEKGVELIVMGESKDFAGKDNVIMKDIEICKGELEKAGMKVEFEREFFTSAHVEQKGDMLDASAAALILQRYLDRKNYQKKTK